MSDSSRPLAETAITELLTTMARLRDPDHGCPWDRKQTFDTIAPYTIEEAFEVAEAVARRDYPELREELGDLLLQVVFHSQMARERGLFDFAEVVSVLNEKMVRRHPHVFGDVAGSGEEIPEETVKANWETIKAAERASKGRAHQSAVDGIPEGLPALQRAHKLQKKAAKVGFDWREIGPVREQVGLELEELDHALAHGDRDAIEDELGDVFFTLVNLARHLKLDPELTLRRASHKFERRFRTVEQLADAPLSDYDEASLDDLWRRAKVMPEN